VFRKKFTNQLLMGVSGTRSTRLKHVLSPQNRVEPLPPVTAKPTKMKLGLSRLNFNKLKKRWCLAGLTLYMGSGWLRVTRGGSRALWLPRAPSRILSHQIACWDPPRLIPPNTTTQGSCDLSFLILLHLHLTLCAPAVIGPPITAGTHTVKINLPFL